MKENGMTKHDQILLGMVFSLQASAMQQMGKIQNPVTGEIAYATQGGPARLIRLSVYGEPDEARTLGTDLKDLRPVLVNLHPNRRAGTVIAAFYRAWGQGEIAMIRSPG